MNPMENSIATILFAVAIAYNAFVGFRNQTKINKLEKKLDEVELELREEQELNMELFKTLDSLSSSIRLQTRNLLNLKKDNQCKFQ